MKADVLPGSMVGGTTALGHTVAKGMRAGHPVGVWGSPSGTVALRADLVGLGALPQISRMPTPPSGRDGARQGEMGVPSVGGLDRARRRREQPPPGAVHGRGAAA